jgi:hypothetical protein
MITRLIDDEDVPVLGPIRQHSAMDGAPDTTDHDLGDEDSRLCEGECWVGDQGIVGCFLCGACTCCSPLDHRDAVAAAWAQFNEDYRDDA